MMHNKELIRRALLGDLETQKECTEKGIVLPCPFCGSKWTQVRYIGWDDTPQAFQAGYRGECTVCNAVTGAFKTERSALAAWNTRPAPQIGKCGECKYSREPTKQDYKELDRYSLLHKDACVCAYDDPKEVWKFDFCSSFKPKEK